MKKTIVWVLLAACIFTFAGLTGYAEEEKAEVSFKIEYREIVTAFKIVPLFIPEKKDKQKTEIKIIDNENEKFSLVERDEEKFLYGRSFFVENTEESIRVIKIKKISTDETMEIRILKKIWFNSLKNGCINGYSVGKYPELKQEHTEELGFIEINKNNIDMKISPHFTLGEFRSKPLTAKLPVYIILDERIIQKIETMLKIFQQKYYYIDKFEIMSGYRTPAHNKNLRNVKNSRHIMGDACDIFIDADKNGKMDDINKDGIVNQADIRVLFDIADEMDNSEEYGYLKGGMSMYESNPVVGEFLHVDTRGTKIRW